MSNRDSILGPVTLADQQMHRMRILLKLLTDDEARSRLPDCDQAVLDYWMLDMARQAKEYLDQVPDPVAKEACHE